MQISASLGPIEVVAAFSSGPVTVIKKFRRKFLKRKKKGMLHRRRVSFQMGAGEELCRGLTVVGHLVKDGLSHYRVVDGVNLGLSFIGQVVKYCRSTKKWLMT